MHREPLALIGVSDISGRVRGKAVPAVHLAEHVARGIGWTPTNVMITAFGPILDTPFGGLGDILMRPVPETEVKVDFGGDGGSEAFPAGGYREYRRHALGLLPAQFPGPRGGGVEGDSRPARLLRVRAGVRLHRRHRRVPQRLHLRRLPPPGAVRRHARARPRRRRHPHGNRSRGVRAGAVRDHLRARPRHGGGRARDRHPRAGARPPPGGSASAPPSRRCCGRRASAAACTSI